LAVPEAGDVNKMYSFVSTMRKIFQKVLEIIKITHTFVPSFKKDIYMGV
jgi:hypothetical protein